MALDAVKASDVQDGFDALDAVIRAAMNSYAGQEVDWLDAQFLGIGWVAHEYRTWL